MQSTKIARMSRPQREIVGATAGRLAGRAGFWTWVAVSLTVVSWASAFVGIRVAVQHYEPAHVALLRYLVASAVLLIYVSLRRMPLPSLRDLPGLAVTGLVGIAFYNVALSYGEVTVPAGTASFIVASVPVFLALLSRLFLRERLRMAGWLGIMVSFAGVAAIALGTGDLRLDPGALAVLSAAVAQASYFLGQKPYLARYSALQCTAYAIWAGTVFLLPLGGGLLSSVSSAPIGATISVIYMGIVPGALGFVAWGYALARIPASLAGSFLYLVPAVAVLIAWIGLGEVPTIVSLAGGIPVVAGVVMVNSRGR